ncbi:NUC173 domain-containing protein [Lipomyces oligophaga]|uniref:NUC173 domain-containing protein n=1 Tax=Lipomyces oligophaga TaxID=45792 RepID=UPI0034CF2EE8
MESTIQMTDMSLDDQLSRIRQHKLSKLANQKQLATILEAVEVTLKDQNTNLSPSAYMVALLSLLGQAFMDDELKNNELASAVVYLLDIVMRHGSHQVLNSQFITIIKYLSPALTHSQATPALVRSAIGCLETMLIAQDFAAWNRPASDLGPRKALAAIMVLAMDERPKVRKRAQDAITTILNSPPPSPAAGHPALSSVADISLSSVAESFAKFNERTGGGRKAHKKENHSVDSSEKHVIYALQLVKAVASNENGWPSSKVDKLCEILFSISKSAEEYLITGVMDVFQTIFTSLVQASQQDDQAGYFSIDAAVFLKIVDSIMDLRPDYTDQNLAPSWLAIVAQCFQTYAEIDPAKAFAKCPALFELLAEFLKAGLPTNVITSASQCMIAVATSCIPVEILVEDPLTRSTKKTLEQISKLAKSLLGVKYQTSWKDIFGFLASLFDAFGFVADPYLIDILTSVGDLRGASEFEGTEQADEIIAAGIRAVGPEKVLEILPLNLEKPSLKQPGRAYLLPLLRDNIRNANLRHYINEMKPLAESLGNRVTTLDSEQSMESKIYETLVEQIWSLLPRYCDLPLDLRQAFTQDFAEFLANTLYQDVGQRQVICKSLRILVESNKLYVAGEIEGLNPFLEARLSKEEAIRNVEYLSSMASKFLAVLFNVFNQTMTEHRIYVLDTIDAFLSITPQKEMIVTFQKVYGLLMPSLEAPYRSSSGNGKRDIPPVSHTMLDLVLAMVAYLPKSAYADLSRVFVITINHDDPQIQRRGYRIISRLAEKESLEGNDDDEGVQYLIANMEALETEITKVSTKVTAPSRGARLNALIDLVRILPSSDLHFIPSILPEAVVSTKEVNEKTRVAAYNLLVVMGDKMAGGGSVAISKVTSMEQPGAKDVDASIEEYFTMVCAGLAGATPHMISATITALSRLMYQYKGILPDPVIQDVVATIDLFLTMKNREIVKSALGFVKVMVTSLPIEILEPRLGTLVPNLMEWAHEHHARFKVKVKHLLERLVRRVGYEKIEAVFPEQDRKLLTNIRKSKERAERKRDADGMDVDEDESEPERPKEKYASEFEAAIYGSSDDDDEEDDDDNNGGYINKGKQRSSAQSKKETQKETYILEGGDDDDPVDLLDNKSLARLSSAKPISTRRKQASSKLKFSAASGKLLVDDDEINRKAIDPDEAMLQSLASKAAEANPVNAYIDAVKNGPVRGQRNKLKFKRRRDDDDDDDDGQDDNHDRQSGGGGNVVVNGKRKINGQRKKNKRLPKF